MSNYLICGYYGFNNTGDDLLLYKTVSLIKEFDKEANIIVLTGPEALQSPEFTTLSRNYFREIFKELKNCDYLIFGGGNLFQDKTSLKSFLYYFAIFTMGLSRKTKCILLANGIGPINTAFAISLFKPTLPLWHHISLRDKESYTFVKQYNNKAIKTCDLAFYKTKIVSRHNEKSGRIALSYRSLLAKKTSTQGLRNFLTEIGVRYQIDFWEFQKETDWQEISKLLKKIAFRTHINKNNFINPELFPDYFIGILTRYHALILASIIGIPFIALAYDEKVIYLAKKLQQPCLDIRRGHIDYNTLISMFNQLKTNYPEYVNRLLINRNLILEKTITKEEVFL